uniref:Putative ovule protein n=1 Tax=Solanum chacoense TaxID=4108 RepID=A0A0V0H390_SOLCH
MSKYHNITKNNQVRKSNLDKHANPLLNLKNTIMIKQQPNQAPISSDRYKQHTTYLGPHKPRRCQINLHNPIGSPLSL